MKNKKTLIIISIIAILAVFIYVQVVEITDEKNDYQWEWFVVLAAFIILEVLVVLIIFLVNRQKYKKLCDAYCNKDYSSVIKLSKCLSSRYLDEKAKDNGRAYLAVANLELENYDRFLEEIDKIRHEDIVCKKYFWLWVYYLKQSEKEQLDYYKECLQNCKDTENKEKALRMLNLIEKRQSNSYEMDSSDLEFVKDVTSDTLKNLMRI